MVGWALAKCPHTGQGVQRGNYLLCFRYQSGKPDPGLHSSWICLNRKGVWMLNNAKWHIAFSLMIINVTHLEGICKKLIMFWRGLYLINYTSITSLFIDLRESVVGPVNGNIFISMLTNLLGWLFIFTWVLYMTKWVFGIKNESPEGKKKKKNTSSFWIEAVHWVFK